MSFKMRVITPQDFVRVDRSGVFDPEASRQMLRTLFRACADSQIPRILVDVRRVNGEVTFREVADLAADLGSLGMERAYRIAILHSPRRVHADFLAEHAQQDGWQVGSFETFEEAFQWLNAMTREPG